MVGGEFKGMSYYCDSVFCVCFKVILCVLEV